MQARYAVLGLLVALCAARLPAQDAKGLQVIGKLPGNEGKRWAICVGINDYYDDKIAKLKKARNDAKALGSVLKGNGQFDYVFVMTDDLEPRDPLFPSKFNIEQKLRSVVEFASPKDLVVFAFSGHGISDAKGEGYLVSVDSRIDDKFSTSVKVGGIVSALAQAGVTKTLLLLDACREEMQESKGLSSEGLREARFAEAEVAATFYATKAGMFSYEDKDSDYGVFSRFVVEGLLGGADSNGDKIVSFNELEAYVQDRVTDWSIRNGRSQKPYTKIYGERYGDLALSAYDRVSKLPASAAALLAQPASAPPSPGPVAKTEAPGINSWETITIDGKLSLSPAALVGDSIYFVGGSYSDGAKMEPSKSILAFDLAAKSLKTVRGLDGVAENASFLEKDGKLYSAGGSKGLTVLDGFQVFDPASGSVSALPKMPTKRLGPTMVSAGGRIYFIGGFKLLSSGLLSSVEYFDLASKAWGKAKDMSSPRCNGAAIAFDDKIYLFGGRSSIGMAAGSTPGLLTSVEVYDTRSDSWHTAAGSLPLPLLGVALVRHGDSILAFGGYYTLDGRSFQTSDRIFSFDPKTETFSERKERLPIPLAAASCTEQDGKIYVYGGASLEGTTSKQNKQIFIFDPDSGI